LWQLPSLGAARGHALQMATTKKRIGAKDLGIDLSKGSDKQAFKWLVACSLFGARISQEIAASAYSELNKAKVLTPKKLAVANWQKLVDLLGAGGYRRYDESTARELITLGRDVLDKYDGKLSNLPDQAASKKEIADRLQEFKGIGPTAARIFLRDMGGAWRPSKP
jgi:endonuclease III